MHVLGVEQVTKPCIKDYNLQMAVGEHAVTSFQLSEKD
jgi:hypothetical protein